MPPLSPIIRLIISVVYFFFVCTAAFLAHAYYAPQRAFMWGFAACSLFLIIFLLSNRKPLKVIGLSLKLLSAHLQLILSAPAIQLGWLYLTNGGKQGFSFLKEAARAYELAKKGHGEQALRICQQLISSSQWSKMGSSHRAYVHVIQGLAHQKMNRLEEAVIELRSAEKMSPNDALVLEHLAVALGLLGQSEESKNVFDKVIKIAPKNTAAYANRAILMLQKGDSESALKDCQAALAIDPKNISAINTSSQANRLLGNFQKAVQESDRALLLNPQSGKAFENRARALMSAGNVAEAIENFTKAIDCSPKNVRVSASIYATRAKLFIDSNEPEKACADCEAALKLDSNSAAAWVNKSISLKKMGKVKEAIQICQAGLQCLNDNIGPIQLHICLSELYIRTNESTLALEHCQAAISIDPDNIIAHNNRAWTLGHLGQIDQALEDMQKCFALSSGNATTFGTRGFIYYLSGRFEEAMNDLDQALTLNPNDSESYFYRGRTREKLGDPGLAIHDFAKASELKFELPAFSTLTIQED